MLSNSGVLTEANFPERFASFLKDIQQDVTIKHRSLSAMEGQRPRRIVPGRRG